MVLITGIASNCTAVLNTFDRFALPALAPVATPAAIIVGALLLGGRVGIWAMVYASLAGALVHAAVVAGMMDRHGYRFRPALVWGNGGYAGGGASVRNRAAERRGGLRRPAGGSVDGCHAALGERFRAGLCQSLCQRRAHPGGGSGFHGGGAPLLAHDRAPGLDRMPHTLRTWVALTALISVPIAAALIAGSHLLIRITFQHGVFGPRDTAVVTPVLAMYAIQIPFFVSSRVFYRFLVAMRRTDLILYCGTLNLILDVVLNLILMRWFGVAGIALATSLWTASTFFFLWYWTWKLLPQGDSGSSADQQPDLI